MVKNGGVVAVKLFTNTFNSEFLFVKVNNLLSLFLGKGRFEYIIKLSQIPHAFTVRIELHEHRLKDGEGHSAARELW